MRQLSFKETQNVSAATFKLHGCLWTVPSTGIPSEYYSLIDCIHGEVFNGRMSPEEGADMMLKLNIPIKYIEQYGINLENAVVTCPH